MWQIFGLPTIDFVYFQIEFIYLQGSLSVMASLQRVPRSWRRSLGYIGLFGVATVTLVQVGSRYRDQVQGNDIFAQHTRRQQRQHLFSGMHEPFLTTDTQQLDVFYGNFPQFSFLVPRDIETLKKKYALQTPVRIKALSECADQTEALSNDRHVVVVGGAPALITGTSLVKKEKNVTYINDERQIPIANGSAWHLEQDAVTEAPTGYHPSQFLISQFTRASVSQVSYASIERTGYFPWRTIDWIGWLRHPEHWLRGIKVFLAYQWFTAFHDRVQTLKRVAVQCVENEKFYRNLNEELNGQLLLDGKGSIIAARNNQEVADLNALKAGLINEGRVLDIISKEEMIKRYGFLPNGLMFGEKTHDKVLTPNFMKLLSKYIKKNGGQTVDGTLTTIYVDREQKGGIVEYQTRDGQKQVVPFSRLIMSLGCQPILKQNNRPLFDVIAARGVSIVAHVYVPHGYQLPPVLVCGDTNHATKLTETPVSFKSEDGKSYDLYLMRFSGGACITPNVSDERTAYYDGTIAVGVLAAVRRTFGDEFKIEPLIVHGCNRQVSRNGELSWMEPFPGIHVQYGAGGGGLTRAPELVGKI